MLNKVTLIGRLTRDVENGATANGTSYARFSLAVQRDFANAQGVREADFINCVAWRGAADTIAKYVHKGDLFAISGRLQTRTYQDQQGNNRSAFDVLVEDFQFISGNNNNSGSNSNQSFNQNQNTNNNNQSNNFNSNNKIKSEEDLLNDFETGFNLDDDTPF